MTLIENRWSDIDVINRYGRRSCTSKTAKIHRFVRLVYNVLFLHYSHAVSTEHVVMIQYIT